MERLEEKFSEVNCLNNSVFGTNVIITQTEGMASYLAMKSAQQNGVFANHKFIKPADFINEIFYLAALRSDSRYGQYNLRWMLFSLIGKFDFKEKYPYVAKYFESDQIKKFHLAVELADMFDQYILFRSDFIEAWNRGEHYVLTNSTMQEDFFKHEDWQFYLWRSLKKYFNHLGADRVELKNNLLLSLKSESIQKKINDAFSQVSFFGMSVVSTYHMEIYNALAEFLEMNFYVLNPSPDSDWNSNVINKYSEDNELFDSLNGLGKASFSLLTKNNSHVCSCDNTKAEIPKINTLLGKIQNDVYTNDTKRRNKISEQNLNDESIIISSSFTPVRELEALYNYVLHIFDNDSSLKAADVLVQISDIEKYTPYIKAVFDNASVKIPYSISDRSYKGSDSIVGMLDQILSLKKDDFTSEIIVQLLDSPFVRNKFDITDLEFIRTLVRDANIRLGIKGRLDDDTRYVSWEYGLQRMLLAYAIKGGQAVESYSDILYPIDSFEGNDAHEMLRFKAFVDALISAVEKRDEARNFEEWKSYVLYDVLNVFIELDENSNDEYEYIINQLNALDGLDDLVSKPLTYDLFYESFNLNVFSETRKGGFINGKMTFCSMIPLRSIPFKVIAMLGVDSDKLPRKTNTKGFNLMRFEDRLGDRSTKMNDRYLFLETIMSARKKLYLSYIGNSVKNKAEQAPSLLIDELLDYIHSENSNAESVIFTRHPMHSFSKQYYSSDSKYYSYLDNWDEQKSSHRVSISANEDKHDFNLVDIKDIISFCKDPFKYYYNRVLRIYYQDEDVLLPETELFSLDNLQEYNSKLDLLVCDNVNEYLEKGKKNGYLPLANMGQVCTNIVNDEIDSLRNQYLEACAQNSEKKINISLQWHSKNEIEPGKLLANIDSIYGDKHLCVNVSGESSRDKNLLEAWIKHLCLMANSCQIDTLFMVKYLDEPIVFSRNIMSSSEALASLESIFKMFCVGHDKIIPFLPKQALKLLNDEKYDEDKMLAEIKKEGISDTFRPWINLYVSKEIELGIFNVYAKEEPDKNMMRDLSEAIFGTLVDKGLV